MARIAKFKPYSGSYPHRDHRSKKGRQKFKRNGFRHRYRKKKEEIRIKDLVEI